MQTEIKSIDSTIFLLGDFNFDSLVDVLPDWYQIKAKKFPSSCVIVDCEQVIKGDSSLLALIIEIRRWAHQKNYVWELKNLPKSLEGFLTVYGIADVLGS
jgi:ABC-type transporter Mla MlaB component